MGLLSIIRKTKQREKEVRILILGLDNAGKTTVLRRLCDEPTDTVEPTLGFSIKSLRYRLNITSKKNNTNRIQSEANKMFNTANSHQIPDTTSESDPQLISQDATTPKEYTLNLWDVGGQKSIRAYWRNYFESTDGIIWVVDGSDLFRLDLCKQELKNLLRQEKLVGAPLLLLVNKQDLPGCADLKHIVKVLELESDVIYQQRNVHLQGCSAFTGAGIKEGMDWLVGEIGQWLFLLS